MTRPLVTSFLAITLAFHFHGCETLDENLQWAKDNQEQIWNTIELINNIPFSEQQSFAAGLQVETPPKHFVSRGKFCSDKPPILEVHKIIAGDDISKSIAEIFPGVAVDAFADRHFAILTLESIEKLIPWTQQLALDLGMDDFADESNDCDNFSRGWRLATRIALHHSYPNIGAEALCASVWVDALIPWANVPAGLHALNFIPYYNPETDYYGIMVVEPQNGTYTDLSLYPNRDRVKRITVSGG